MSITTWRLFQRARTSAWTPKRPRFRFRPSLERLETRWVPSTLYVSPSGHHDHDSPVYRTIEDAVMHATAGDTIQVEPGTYREQVVIPSSDSNLKLLADGHATIQAPNSVSGPGAIVEIDAPGVVLNGFTITGPSNGLNYGVLVQTGGPATNPDVIANNHITQILNNASPTTGTGIGIEVGNNLTNKSASATIDHNTIDNYQKGGITVEYPGSRALVTDNTVVGTKNSPVPQNGIQISNGAVADVRNNNVSNNVASPSLSFQSAGILLYQSGAGTTVESNQLAHNDAGIGVLDVTAPNTVIRNNQIRASTSDGIDLLDTTTGVTVSNNHSWNNGQDGIYVNANGNTIDHNQVNNNQEDGIQIDGSGGLGMNNTVTNNTAMHNAQYGIAATNGASGNKFNNNTASGNKVDDFFDWSKGTANTWTNNTGQTDNANGQLIAQKSNNDQGDQDGNDQDHENPRPRGHDQPEDD